MGTTLTRNGNRECLWWWNDEPAGRRVDLHDRGSAERYMQVYVRDPRAMTALRSMLARELGTGPVLRLLDTEVISQVAVRLASRRLSLTQDVAALAAPSVVQRLIKEEPPPPPAEKREEHEFILILEDKKGKRLPRQRYIVVFPDGARFTGRLGEDGMVRLTDVPPGKPKVFFPEHHVVAPHGHRPAGAERCGIRRK
jgi:hypothetical protein